MTHTKRSLPGPNGMRFLPVGSIAKLAARAMDDGGDDGRTRYEVAVSSEYEVERNFYGTLWREVLDHSADSIVMDRFQSGSAAVLVDHGGDQVGVVESARVDADRVMRAVVRFSQSERGREIEKDVEDGIRRNISVGYLPKRAKLMQEDPDRGDLWRMTLWEPVELSLVGVPADPTVGVGRSTTTGAVSWPVEIEDGEPVAEERTMDEKNTVAPAHAAETTARAASPTTADMIAEANKRAAEIVDMCEANGLGALATDMIRRGIDVGAAAREILAKRASSMSTPAQPGAESMEDLGMKGRDLKRYSYARAILGAAAVGEQRRFDGVEWEVHRELERRHPEGAARRGGLLVPTSLGATQRALDTKTVTKGAEAVYEQAGELIELLRNRTAVLQLGARSLTGLTSPIAFPKQTGPLTANWVGENGAAVASSDVAFALALLSPKTLQATTAYSRQLLAQAAFDVESMVREELALVHSIAIDYAAIHGLGAAGEPVGIYSATGVSSHAFAGAADYSKLLVMIGKVAALNADLGSLGWLMHPTVATNLKGKPMFSNTATPTWEGPLNDGRVGGYRAIATNQVSSTMTGSERTGGTDIGNVFGNWNDCIVGSWGALELVVDPYAQKKSGLIEVTSFQLADVLARHGESFCKSTGCTA